VTTLNKRVIILGGGGHAGVLIEILRMLNIKIIGVADPNLSRESVVHGGIPVIGCDEAVMSYTPDETMLVNGMGPAHKNSYREVLSRKFISAGHKFLTLVHPQAYVSPSAQISPGVQIMAGAVVQTKSFIGEMAVINTGAIVDHNCRVDDYTHLGPGSVLCGGVETGCGVFVGAGSVVIENLSLGRNALLAAGVTLRRDLKAGETFFGK
jgi:UDP-perosamine 4-acetyltransferase